MNTRISSARLLGLVLVTLVLSFPAVTRANEQVYEKLLPSAVMIKMNGSSGSGAVVDVQKKWVLTNYHVVGDQEMASVVFPFKSSVGVTYNGYMNHAGKVIHRDKSRDLAVIELSNLPSQARQVPLAAVSAKPGQTVHLIGNPGLGQGKPTLWVYSYGKARQVERLTSFIPGPNFTLTLDCQILLTTLPSNGGDSGGPVVNDSGELVAVVHGDFPGKNAIQKSIDISEIHAALAQVGNTAQKR
jgi:S1-C subfamily serine protease